MSWVFHVKAERVEQRRDNARNEADNFIVNYVRETEGNQVIHISPRVYSLMYNYQAESVESLE